MISHVNIGITDFERAFAFYQSVMEELGFTLKFSEPEKAWAGWMRPGVSTGRLSLIGHPYNGERATPGNGQMVALLAPTGMRSTAAMPNAIEVGLGSRKPLHRSATLRKSQHRWLRHGMSPPELVGASPA